MFVAIEPLRGWRAVQVTERRTAYEYAHFIKDLVDEEKVSSQKVGVSYLYPELLIRYFQSFRTFAYSRACHPEGSEGSVQNSPNRTDASGYPLGGRASAQNDKRKS